MSKGRNGRGGRGKGFHSLEVIATVRRKRNEEIEPQPWKLSKLSSI